MRHLIIFLSNFAKGSDRVAQALLIQEFPGAAKSESGSSNLLFWSFFPEKLHKLKKKLDREGTGDRVEKLAVRP